MILTTDRPTATPPCRSGRCGFLYEGTLRQCEQLFDGKTYDNECYALVGNE